MNSRKKIDDLWCYYLYSATTAKMALRPCLHLEAMIRKDLNLDTLLLSDIFLLWNRFLLLIKEKVLGRIFKNNLDVSVMIHLLLS